MFRNAQYQVNRYSKFHSYSLILTVIIPITNYTKKFLFQSEQVRNCKLEGLNDLNQGLPYVQEQIINYMNGLIDLGVGGFRVDACKHMWPDHLEVIFQGLNDLNPEYFPAGTRPFIFQEVIDRGKNMSANH